MSAVGEVSAATNRETGAAEAGRRDLLPPPPRRDSVFINYIVIAM
jgi:hypothetical protein